MTQRYIIYPEWFGKRGGVKGEGGGGCFHGNIEGRGQTLYYNQLAKINLALGITALVMAFIRQLSTGTLRPDMGKLPLTLTAPNDVDSARRLIVAPKRPEVHY